MRGIDTPRLMRWAKEIPTWLLERELAERKRGERRESPVVVLPGLEIDPVASTMVWNGEVYAVGGRRMEVLYALAQEREKGRRRVQIPYLGRRVFIGFGAPEATEITRTYLCYLNREFPGLLSTPNGRPGVGYGLNVAEEAQARAA